MIIKDFTIPIPDQPFKTTTELDKKLTATYEGEEFIIISIDKDNIVQAVENRTDDPDIRLENYVDHRYTHHLIDANKHTLWVAWLTNCYKYEDYPNYEEELPDSSKYTYNYAESSIMDSIFKHFAGYTYDPVTDQFSEPKFLEWTQPGNETFATQCANEITRWNAIDTSKYNDTIKTEINTYIAWLNDAPTTFEGVDPWKIPWPAQPIIPT